MSTKCGIGIIGCGEIAQGHAKAISVSSNAKISMVMDVNVSLGRSLAEKHNVIYTTKTEELLANKDVKIVYIATPHYLHANQAIMAAKAGKHVMLEKPIATKIKDAEKIIKICLEQKVNLGVCYITCYTPAIEKAHSIVQQGGLGKIYGLKTTMLYDKPESYWQGGYSGRNKNDWRASKEKSGGGIMLMNMSHYLQQIKYITGLDVVRVYAELDTFDTPMVEVEDTISVALRYSNGAIGSVDACSSIKGGQGMGVVPMDRIYGTKGHIEILGYNALNIWTDKKLPGKTKGKWQKIELKPSDKFAGRKLFIEDFVRNLKSGKKQRVNGEEGKKMLEIVLGSYASAKKKKAVNL